MRHDAHLDGWHDAYKGHRVFVLGTGLSLNSVPAVTLDHLLRTEYAWGVNLVRRCLAARQIKSPPSFYACSEGDWLDVIEQERRAYTPAPIGFFAHPSPVEYPSWVWVPRTSGDLDMARGDMGGMGEHFGWAANGRSVVMDVCVQMSVWMGFDRIYLLGCDNTLQGHCYYEDDPSDKKRFATMEGAAIEAVKLLRPRGIELIDLTEGGTLPIRRSTLDAVLT